MPYSWTPWITLLLDYNFGTVLAHHLMCNVKSWLNMLRATDLVNIDWLFTHFAWKALFVPRWSRSWQKHPTIRARVSVSVSTSWNPAVWTTTEKPTTTNPPIQWLNYGLKDHYWFKLQYVHLQPLPENIITGIVHPKMKVLSSFTANNTWSKLVWLYFLCWIPKVFISCIW